MTRNLVNASLAFEWLIMLFCKFKFQAKKKTIPGNLLDPGAVCFIWQQQSIKYCLWTEKLPYNDGKVGGQSFKDLSEIFTR